METLHSNIWDGPMSRETELLHRISQSRNKRNAPGTDEVLKDCVTLITDYGDLVDKHAMSDTDDLLTQIADLATKLTVAEDKIATLVAKPATSVIENIDSILEDAREILTIKPTSLILPPGVKLEDAKKILASASSMTEARGMTDISSASISI